MALAAIQDILPSWPGWTQLDLSYGDETSGQATGDLIVKELRPPRWTLHAESKMLSPSEIRKWKAILDGLDNGKSQFYGYELSALYPILYPNGSWPTGTSFSGLTAQIHSLGSNSKSLALDHLPSGYVLSIGDMISFSYGSGPSLALHRVVESATANGSGITGTFEVRPAIRTGASTGSAVAVKKPLCAMVISPGSISTPKDVTARGSISFDAVQVF